MRMLIPSTCLCLLVFTLANAQTDRRSFETNGGRFELVDGGLMIEVEVDAGLHSTSISDDGDLSFNGTPHETTRGERKQLRKFLGEVTRMSELVDQVGAEVARQVDPATKSDQQEKIAKNILKIGRKLEKQNLKVAKIAMELVQRFPELDEVFRSFVSEE